MAAANTTKQGDLRSSYWAEARRPLASLVFIAPMLLFYEAGIVWLGPGAVRNAADVWLRRLLDLLGFSQYLLLPFLTCGLLLAWHYVSRRSWRFDSRILFGMLAESMAFGFLLLLIAGWQGRFLAHAAAAGSAPSIAATLVAYVGAGIYEELLFRLMLLPAAWWLLRWFGLSPRTSLATAVLVTSLFFAAAHYQFHLQFFGYGLGLSSGEPFQWFSFLFRFLAGTFFSLLMLFRGFGITAGTHAMYDVYTLLL
jgi:membrane protease YdiL (CAAX protease family)